MLLCIIASHPTRRHAAVIQVSGSLEGGGEAMPSSREGDLEPVADSGELPSLVAAPLSSREDEGAATEGGSCRCIEW